MWLEIEVLHGMTEEVGAITGINISALAGMFPISRFNIANRMAWASRRVTTRPGDLVYCLLEIFEINMLLLYGEGSQKAFLQLQQEILHNLSDQSIFAWSNPGPPVRGGD